MARIRTIKPEFWQDEKLAPMCALDRLVFIGLISQADDKGRVVDNAKLIDGLLFAETSETCRGSLDALAKIGRIRRGRTASGQRIIEITNWHHQRIDKPNYHGALPEIVEDSTNDPVSVEEESQNHISTYDLRSVPVPPLPPPPSAEGGQSTGTESERSVTDDTQRKTTTSHVGQRANVLWRELNLGTRRHYDWGQGAIALTALTADFTDEEILGAIRKIARTPGLAWAGKRGPEYLTKRTGSGDLVIESVINWEEARRDRGGPSGPKRRTDPAPRDPPKSIEQQVRDEEESLRAHAAEARKHDTPKMQKLAADFEAQADAIRERLEAQCSA